MQQLGLYDPYGLVFLTPNTHSNVYDHLLARVWCRSLNAAVYTQTPLRPTAHFSVSRIGDGQLTSRFRQQQDIHQDAA